MVIAVTILGAQQRSRTFRLDKEKRPSKTKRDIEHNRFSSRSITYKCDQSKSQIF